MDTCTEHITHATEIGVKMRSAEGGGAYTYYTQEQNGKIANLSDGTSSPG